MWNEVTATKIIDIADQKALEFMGLEPGKEDFNPGLFEYLMKQAIFGFRSKRELMLAKRAEGDQKLRAIKYAFSDPEQREKYIRSTMPKLLKATSK